MKVLDPALFNIRRETILQHARHLFATKGFAETSMDDIAHASKMQKASLYHYFESKEWLLRSMIRLERDRWFARLKDYDRDGSLPETLKSIATGFLKEMDDAGKRDFFTILHFESHKNPWIYKAWKESPTQDGQGFYALFARHLDGRWPRMKVAIFITQFMGALIHYAVVTKLRRHHPCDQEVEDAPFVEQLVETFHRGIGNGEH